ncbi:MAG: GHKL domain-containing protein [Eubacteriales bacterium]|nr:GHKL domain-containing protein [Eubacteriales bacterium]
MNELNAGSFFFEFAARIFDLFIVFYISTRNSPKRKDNLYFLLSIIIAIGLIGTILSNAIGQYDIIATLVPALGLFFAIKGFYDIKSFNLLISFGLATLLIIVIANVSVVFYSYILDVNASTLMLPGFDRVIYKITSKLLVILPAYMIGKFLSYAEIKISYFSIVTLVVVFINVALTFLSINFYLDAELQNSSEFFYAIIALLIITASSILVINLAFKVIQQERKELKWNSMKKEYDNQLKHMDEINRVLKTMSANRHDYIAHLEAIGSLLKSREFGEAELYANQLLSEEQDIGTRIRTDNKLISAILNYKERAINAMDIRFEHYVNIPDVLPVEDVDLTIIVTNALNNAIEACERMTSDRSIELYMNFELNKLKIKIMNTFDGELKIIGNRIETLKDNDILHGRGLENIRTTVEKYNGYYKISSNGNLFIMEVLI